MLPHPTSRPLPPSRSASVSSSVTFHNQRVTGTTGTLASIGSTPTLNLVTRNSMTNLAAATQAQNKAKSAAWMQKIRKWKSKDDGLWGCAGDFPGEDRGVLPEEDEEDYGVAFTAEAKQLPALPLESYQHSPTYEHSSSSDMTYSSGSGYSSVRSSYGSQHRGRASGIGGGEGSTRSSVHSVHSVRSSGITSPSSAARADRLAKEQEDALAAITSYMARTTSAAPSRRGSPSVSNSPSLPSSPTRHAFPSTSTAGGTIRPSDRKASLVYARQQARTSAANPAVFAPTSAAPAYASPAAAAYSPSARPRICRSPSTSSLHGPVARAAVQSSSAGARSVGTTGRQRAFSSAGEGGYGARYGGGMEPVPALPPMGGLGLERVGEEKRGYGFI